MWSITDIHSKTVIVYCCEVLRKWVQTKSQMQLVVVIVAFSLLQCFYNMEGARKVSDYPNHHQIIIINQ